MINDFKTYENYFRHLAAINKRIKYFQAGDSEKIIASLKDLAEYPLLWMESPSFSHFDAGGLQTNIDGAIVIMDQANVDDYVAEAAIMDDVFDICQEIIAKMMVDAEDDLFDLNLSTVNLEPIESYIHDNGFGWRMTFNLSSAKDDCLTSEFHSEYTLEVESAPAGSTDLVLTLKAGTELIAGFQSDHFTLISSGPTNSIGSFRDLGGGRYWFRMSNDLDPGDELEFQFSAFGISSDIITIVIA